MAERDYSTRVNKFPQKGTRKWETEYVLVAGDPPTGIDRGDSQTEMTKTARAWARDNKASCAVVIQKRLTNGDRKVAEVIYLWDDEDEL